MFRLANSASLFKFSLILGIIFAYLFFFPILPVFADCEPQVILPPCACSGNCELNDFLALGARLINYGIGILSVVALFFIIYGGFIFLTGMGNPERIDSGKKILGGTLQGIVIVLLSWTLVNSIIFLFIGNTSGRLFGDTSLPWWEFKETPISNVCPTWNNGDCTYKRECTDTMGWDEQKKSNSHCWGYGVCSGNENIICCDTGEFSGTGCSPQATNEPTCNNLEQIANQYSTIYPAGDAPDLTDLRNCIESNVPSYMIDQNQIYTTDESHYGCNFTRGNPDCDSQCSHSVNSCHYGGISGNQGAQGIDYNAAFATEQELYDAVVAALNGPCAGLSSGVLFESNHTHVSSINCDN